MDDAGKLLEAIDLLYGSILDDADYSKSLESLTNYVDAASVNQGVFSPDDQQRFMPLIPHVIRALQIRELFKAARQARQAYWEAVQCMPFGVAFLDQHAKVLEISNSAKRLTSMPQGIRYKDGFIHASHPQDDRRLQKTIFETIGATARRTIPNNHVTARRETGRSALNIVATPVRSDTFFNATAPHCMLLILDPESSPTPAVKLVQKSLHLTEAEALLACVLFTGVSLREAADQLGVSINTCKTQLKSIYAKTGCRSHVDLAKIIAMSSIANSLQG